MEINRTRGPKETMHQYRGRIKRETNAANDALKLQKGEPVWYGNRKMRFELRMINRVSPTVLRRLEGEELASFLAQEAEQKNSTGGARPEATGTQCFSGSS